jgi:hypothetical protein
MRKPVHALAIGLLCPAISANGFGMEYEKIVDREEVYHSPDGTIRAAVISFESMKPMRGFLPNLG